jgi:hypothetical protein
MDIPLETLDQELCQGLTVRLPGGRSDRQGRQHRETLENPSRHPGDIPNGSGQASHRMWSWAYVTIIQHISNISYSRNSSHCEY